MSIFNSNRTKAQSINNSIAVCERAKASFSREIAIDNNDKDFVINVVVNSASAKIALSARGLDSQGLYWLTAETIIRKIDGSVITDMPVSNETTLPIGRYRVVLPRILFQNNVYKSLTVTFNIANSSEVSASYIFEDKRKDMFFLVNADTSFKYPMPKGKKYKIEVLELTSSTPSSDAVFNYLTGAVDVSYNILTESPRITRKNGIVAIKGAKYYIDNVFASATLQLTKTTSNLVFSIEEIEEIPPIVQYKNLYTNTTSIGSGLSYDIKPQDKAVIVRVDVYANVGATVSNSVFMRDKNGTLLENNWFRMHGTNVVGTNFQTNTTGTYYIVANVPINGAKVHVGSTIVGTAEVSVNIIGDVNVWDFENDFHEKQVVFENEKLIVDVHRVASRHTKYENWEAWINPNINSLYVSDGTTIKTIPFTDLPNWKANDYPSIMGFIPYKQGGADASSYSRENAVRFCVITVYGNVYHNFPAAADDDKTVVNDFGKFDLSAIYEPTYSDKTNESVSSVRIPVNTNNLTDEEKKIKRYEPGLPAWNYTQTSETIGGKDKNGNIYGNNGHPQTLLKDGVHHIRAIHPVNFGEDPQGKGQPYTMGNWLSQAFAVKSKMTVVAPYNGTPAKRHLIMGTTDGGRRLVVLNEIGVTGWAGTFANSLDFSAFGAYNSGELFVSVRNYNYPTSEIKEPENAFKYSKAVAVSNIATTGGKTIVTTATPHKFEDSSAYVVFKATGGNYAFLDNSAVCSDVEEKQSNDVGNGRFYAAKRINATQFELLQNFGGADEYFDCWHIHSVTPDKDGFNIACGEEYPHGSICRINVPQIDDFESYKIWNHRIGQGESYSMGYVLPQKRLYRLNSGKASAQRAVGVILRDDKEQTLLYASDVSYVKRGVINIEGRTQAKLPTRNSGGLFKAPIKDIDDLSKFECILELQEASLGLVEQSGMMAVIGMSKNLYVNVGDIYNRQDWITVPRLCKFTGYDANSLYFRDLNMNLIYQVRRK